MSSKKRYVIVGTGARAGGFIDAIAKNHADTSELVGLCDTNLVRMQYHNKRLREGGLREVPTYDASNFDEMLRDQRPHAVIVCTVDAFHHQYIVGALNANCDAICEKPMTIDETKCREIFDAVERSGKSVIVTFNLRWHPGFRKVKKILQEGTLGRIHTINMEWTLDTGHGADYFHRWHSTKKLSGGLQVHKSTHHFDLLNWWMDSVPEEVYSFSDLSFYGAKNAIRRGKEEWTIGDRYTGERIPADAPFVLDLQKNARLKALYQDGEAIDGYHRDQNVFRSGVDIDDEYQVLVRYRSGSKATYSFNAFSPIEGTRVAITGDLGRLEYHERMRFGSGVKDFPACLPASYQGDNFRSLVFLPLEGAPKVFEIDAREGGHGGSDPCMYRRIFGDGVEFSDGIDSLAGHEQAAASLLIGVAASVSADQRRPVSISELLPLSPEAEALSELC